MRSTSLSRGFGHFLVASLFLHLFLSLFILVGVTCEANNHQRRRSGVVAEGRRPLWLHWRERQRRKAAQHLQQQQQQHGSDSVVLPLTPPSGRDARTLSLSDDQDRIDIVSHLASHNEVDPEDEGDSPTLNVSEPDSPYALIDRFFPDREASFARQRSQFERKFHKGHVWLSDGNLLVLKGGSTVNREGFDDVWEPLDDYQAPYREPKLPPPDFVPVEHGVGVPLEPEWDEDSGLDSEKKNLARQNALEEQKEKEAFEQELLRNHPGFFFGKDVGTNLLGPNNKNQIEDRTTGLLFRGKEISSGERATSSKDDLNSRRLFLTSDDLERHITRIENFNAARHVEVARKSRENNAKRNDGDNDEFFYATASPDSYSYAYATTTPKPITAAFGAVIKTVSVSPTVSPNYVVTTHRSAYGQQEMAKKTSSRPATNLAPKWSLSQGQRSHRQKSKSAADENSNKFAYVRELKTKPQSSSWQQQQQHYPVIGIRNYGGNYFGSHNDSNDIVGEVPEDEILKKNDHERSLDGKKRKQQEQKRLNNPFKAGYFPRPLKRPREKRPRHLFQAPSEPPRPSDVRSLPTTRPSSGRHYLSEPQLAYRQHESPYRHLYSPMYSYFDSHQQLAFAGSSNRGHPSASLPAAAESKEVDITLRPSQQLFYVTDKPVAVYQTEANQDFRAHQAGKPSTLQQKISQVSSSNYNPSEQLFFIGGEKSDVNRRSDQFVSFYGGGTGGMRPWGYSYRL